MLTSAGPSNAQHDATSVYYTNEKRNSFATARRCCAIAGSGVAPRQSDLKAKEFTWLIGAHREAVE